MGPACCACDPAHGRGGCLVGYSSCMAACSAAGAAGETCAWPVSADSSAWRVCNPKQ